MSIHQGLTTAMAGDAADLSRTPWRFAGHGAILLALAAAVPHLVGVDRPVAAPAVSASALLPPLTAEAGDVEPAAAGDAPAADDLFELTLRLDRSSGLGRLLEQAGARPDDVAASRRLLEASIGQGLLDGADVKLTLGTKGPDGRPIERMALVTDLGATILARRGRELAVDRPRGRIVSIPLSGDLYWSLRGGGLTADDAMAASRMLRGKPVEAGRPIEVAMAARPGRFDPGAERAQFISATIAGHGRLRALRWPGSPDGWIDPDRPAGEAGLGRPVAGPITSRFGFRFHPILQFFRAHQGIDFGGASGTPVRAAADGTVGGAGWHGGYGRQVRLSHAGALETSYSHLSAMAVVAGQRVHRGDLIGFIGASGLATGPHLHFEVRRDGRPIDPLTASLAGTGRYPSQADVARRLGELGVS